MQNNLQIIQGIILIISSQIVVSASNPIYRITAQVIVFIINSFIFMIQDFYFQGLTYIIVYVGAIAIQFLFVIMMVQIPSFRYKPINNIPKEIISSSNLSKIKIPKEIITNNIDNKYINHNASLIFKNIPHYDFKNIFIIKNEIHNNFPMKYIFLQFIFIINFISQMIQIKENIYTYIYPIWSIDYKTMYDIETFGHIIYIGHPIIQILIGIILWIILIGIISICKDD